MFICHIHDAGRGGTSLLRSRIPYRNATLSMRTVLSQAKLFSEETATRHFPGNSSLSLYCQTSYDLHEIARRQPMCTRDQSGFDRSCCQNETQRVAGDRQRSNPSRATSSHGGLHTMSLRAPRSSRSPSSPPPGRSGSGRGSPPHGPAGEQQRTRLSRAESIGFSHRASARASRVARRFRPPVSYPSDARAPRLRGFDSTPNRYEKTIPKIDSLSRRDSPDIKSRGDANKQHENEPWRNSPDHFCLNAIIAQHSKAA
jgi:hypothetical protein